LRHRRSENEKGRRTSRRMAQSQRHRKPHLCLNYQKLKSYDAASNNGPPTPKFWPLKSSTHGACAAMPVDQKTSWLDSPGSDSEQASGAENTLGYRSTKVTTPLWYISVCPARCW